MTPPSLLFSLSKNPSSIAHGGTHCLYIGGTILPYPFVSIERSLPRINANSTTRSPLRRQQLFQHLIQHHACSPSFSSSLGSQHSSFCTGRSPCPRTDGCSTSIHHVASRLGTHGRIECSTSKAPSSLGRIPSAKVSDVECCANSNASVDCWTEDSHSATFSFSPESYLALDKRCFRDSSRKWSSPLTVTTMEKLAWPK